MDICRSCAVSRSGSRDRDRPILPRSSNLAEPRPQMSSLRPSSNLLWSTTVPVFVPMSDRIRHCAQCPQCRTWYILGFSPYRNGAALVQAIPDSSEEYILYCSCVRPPFVSRWRWRDVQTCAVSPSAHHRGYGSADEIAITYRTRARRR